MNPDGTLKWIFTIEKTDMHRTSLYASPAMGADGTIYCGSNDSYLHAFNPDGSHKWMYKTKGEIYQSPVIGLDGTVYFPSEDRSIYAINPDGNEKWIRADVVPENSEESPGSPVITDDGTLILDFGFSNRIVGLDAATGQTKWERKLTDKILELGTKAPPAIAPDGTIYAYADFKYHAIKGSSPLARSSWPTMGGNNSRPGRISDY